LNRFIFADLGHMRKLLPLLILSLSSFGQNPIQAAKDAFKKAQQDMKASRPPAAPNAPSSAPSSAARAASSQGWQPKGTVEELAQAAGGLDIRGIKLGSPLKQAMTGLKAHNPSMQLSTQTVNYSVLPGPLLYGVSAVSPQEKMYFHITLPPSPPLVYKIARFVSFTRESAPTQQVVVEDLMAKYGKPVFDSGPNSLRAHRRDLYWIVEGKRDIDLGQLQACLSYTAFTPGEQAPFIAQPQNNTSEIEQSANVAAIPEESAGCRAMRMVVARLFHAVALGVSSPDVVGSMTVVVGDDAIKLASDLKARAMLIEALQNRDKQQQDAAKKNRPVL
jgi:hypothetical protein